MTRPRGSPPLGATSSGSARHPPPREAAPLVPRGPAQPRGSSSPPAGRTPPAPPRRTTPGWRPSQRPGGGSTSPATPLGCRSRQARPPEMTVSSMPRARGAWTTPPSSSSPCPRRSRPAWGAVGAGRRSPSRSELCPRCPWGGWRTRAGAAPLCAWTGTTGRKRTCEGRCSTTAPCPAAARARPSGSTPRARACGWTRTRRTRRPTSRGSRKCRRRWRPGRWGGGCGPWGPRWGRRSQSLCSRGGTATSSSSGWRGPRPRSSGRCGRRRRAG
mmetsp:Transcript_36299/g.114571  ORF Transcript_36299/g.114571 Transcript_36299/m.114571 type:complete len:272 (+) Transcript_36299:214-1029(+)